jgi:hypothetical protein
VHALVRAWRGGLVTLLLDGFDEMATTGWGGSLHKVRAHRYSGMTLVRKFIQESPPNTSVIVAGRHNFFDNLNEMANSLGVERGFDVLYTNDFSDEQAKRFLHLMGVYSDLPEWMPKRPLLLGYLAGAVEASMNPLLMFVFREMSADHEWPAVLGDGPRRASPSWSSCISHLAEHFGQHGR